MNDDLEQLKRFVRESPWEHEQVEEHLRAAVPRGVEGLDTALIVDGMGIPEKGDHCVGVARQWWSSANPAVGTRLPLYQSRSGSAVVSKHANLP